MTNPTTPFNWQMPTSTDLVTDLPADFETFGQAVATSMADLLGGTSGQILAKASNTDMDFTWVTNDVGDITAVTASSPLTGGGTSGAITVGIQDATTSVKGAVQLTDSTSSTSTTTAATPNSVKSAYDLANGAIPKSLIDAAGDLILGTAADTAGRLAIGAANTILTSNGTTASWAAPAGGGGYTQLAAGSLSGTSVVLSSINSGYKDLQLIIKSATWGTGNSYLTLQTNSVTANYDFTAALAANTFGGFVYASSAQSVWRFASDAPQTFNNDQNMYVVNLYDYAATNDTKLGSVDFRMDTGVSRVYGGALAVAGVDAAISSLTISTNAGYTFNGGTYILYGVK